jgi:hypothetical protein
VARQRAGMSESESDNVDKVAASAMAEFAGELL